MNHGVETKLHNFITVAGGIPPLYGARGNIRDKIFEIFTIRIPRSLEIQGEIYTIIAGLCEIYDVFFCENISHIQAGEVEKEAKFYQFTKKYIIPYIKDILDYIIVSGKSDQEVVKNIKQFIDFLDTRGWYKIFEIAKYELPYLAYWEEQSFTFLD